MMTIVNEIILAVSGSPAGSIVAKVTVVAALGLAGSWLERRNRAAVRHALLAVTFAAILVLPIASIVAPPVRLAVPVVVASRVAFPSVVGTTGAIPSMTAADGARVTPAVVRASRLSLRVLLFAGWIAGTALFLLPMAIGLWQIRSLRRSALPWRHGQSVVETLAPDTRIHRRVEVLLNESLPGPMVCGVLHPAIVVPADAESWAREDLNRAMVHELEHVRRGDSVSRWLARTACAVYWFHPLVWIAWRKLVLEAERSCDDAVLTRSEATAYADQLVGLAKRLSMAQRSLLLAMANRADLATRVGAVLDSQQRRGRAGTLRVALACGGAVALVIAMSPLTLVAAPQSTSSQNVAMPEFDVVSVKLIDPNVGSAHSSEHTNPGRLLMTGNLHRFIVRAYGITEGQLSGEPDWFKTRLYSIDAVTSVAASQDRMMLMLRSALANRFQLKLRQEDRDLPVYVLEVAPGGPKFKELKPGEVPSDAPEPPGIFVKSFSSVQNLVNSLNNTFGGRLSLDRPVVDRTHLTGNYNIHFQTEIETQADDGRGILQFPNLFSDMQSELGLKLVPARVKMPYFVVEQAAAPTPN
jgi:uncharacterized protein (TIGR03435 family)